jgi:putative chitinase
VGFDVFQPVVMSDLSDLLGTLFARPDPAPAAAAAMAILTGTTGISLPPTPPPKPTIDVNTPTHHDPLPGLDRALQAAAPHLGAAEIAAWVAVMTDPLRHAEITTPRRVAAFVGQCAVESGGFRCLEENLNYSAGRLRQVWPQRFPTVDAANACAFKPEKLADQVYCNRLGNRDPESGDGWHFRGRGLIQVTGRANYERFAQAAGCDIEAAVQLAGTHAGAAQTAAWFWTANALNPLAESWRLDALTAKINGGSAGASERKRLCEAALHAIGP